MYLDIIKNPIVLGVFAGAIVYLYLMWSNNKKKDLNKKDISLITPIITAIIVSIIAYAYFGTSSSPTVLITEQTIPEKIIEVNPQVLNNNSYQVVKDISESPTSFHLISKGVNIPNNINIPEVFIETY